MKRGFAPVIQPFLFTFSSTAGRLFSSTNSCVLQYIEGIRLTRLYPSVPRHHQSYHDHHPRLYQRRHYASNNLIGRPVRNLISTPMSPVPISSLYSTTLSNAQSTLQAKRLVLNPSKNPKPKVPLEKLQFGHTFTDNMLVCRWNDATGWDNPTIMEYGDLLLPPSASVLHYGIECFEGLKAYKDRQGKVRLFRPQLNMERLLCSAERLALPSFDKGELLTLIERLLRVEESWIPAEPGYSLYIRPTIIGTQESLGVAPPKSAMLFVICCPVGPYYRTGFNAVSLYAEDKYVRAWPGGTGAYKIGANYAGGILPQTLVAPAGYQQVLWLFGPTHQITEVGTMNCFVFLLNQNGEKELVSPPLTDGTILPGVTRDSILGLARNWAEFTVSERQITMQEVCQAIEEGRMLEMFGSGTAAVISPIKRIHYAGKDWMIPLDPADPKSQAGPLARRLWEAITTIQYGEVDHPWSYRAE